jgi:large subunit ribosomal protein L9
MKVILSQDVEHVGHTGQTVKVADGFARNYLLPRKMAVHCDSGSAKQIDHERKVIARREEKRRAVLTEVAKGIEALTVDFQVRAGAEDKIFGSVTTVHIADRLAEMGHPIDRKSIHLEEPIKSIGIFLVPVRLASGIEANLKVWVSAIEEPGAQAAPEQTS